MPSVWIEPRKNKHGRYFLLRWEWKESDPRDPAKEVTRRDQKIFVSRGKAEDELTKKRTALIEGAPAASAGDHTLHNAIEIFLSDAMTSKKASTVDHFDRPALALLEEFAGSARRLSDFRGDDMQGKQVLLARTGKTLIQQWKLWLLEKTHAKSGRKKGPHGYHPNTVNMWMAVGQKFLNFFGIQPNPFYQVERPAKVEVRQDLTDEQIRRIRELVPAHIARFFLFVAITGPRRGEALNIQVENIKELTDPKTGERFWLAKTSGKTGERIVEMDELAMDILRPLPESGPLFPGITSNVVSHYLKTIAKGLGLDRLRCHDLRHNWADRAAQTLDLGAWMNAGGWKSMASARGYLSRLRTRRGLATSVNYGLGPTISPPINMGSNEKS